jgi:hypothetical protein
VRRFQSIFKIVLLAVVLLAAAGTPAVAARPVTGVNARIERIEKKKQSLFVSWLKNWRSKLSRYAMAAS